MTDLRLRARTRGLICDEKGRSLRAWQEEIGWLEFWLQHPAVRNLDSPSFGTPSHDPARGRSCCDDPRSLRPSWLIQGWRDEEAHSRSEMGRAGEQESQIPSRPLDRRRRFVGYMGRAGGEVQADPEPADLGILQYPALAFLAA
jgi:hypothetical protein